MKRLLVVLMTAVLVLSGCGAKEADKPAAQEPAPAPAQETAAPATEGAVDNGGLFQLMQGSVDYMSKGVSYDYAMTAGGDTIRSHFAFKNGESRFEGGAAGNESVMITKADGLYILNMKEKTGFKMPPGDSGAAGAEGTGDIHPEETMDRDAVKIIGSEDVNGEPCHVFTTKDKVAGYEMKMWVHKKYGIMMRMEAESPEGQMKIEISNLKVGDVADSGVHYFRLTLKS